MGWIYLLKSLGVADDVQRKSIKAAEYGNATQAKFDEEYNLVSSSHITPITSGAQPHTTLRLPKVSFRINQLFCIADHKHVTSQPTYDTTFLWMEIKQSKSTCFLADLRGGL